MIDREHQPLSRNLTTEHQILDKNTVFMRRGCTVAAHPQNTKNNEKTMAHCNTCSGDRSHEVLHSEVKRWSDDEQTVSGGDSYDTLKCGGCEEIKLRHESWFSEDEGMKVRYYPPAIFRREPAWFKNLWLQLDIDNDFLQPLLKEIYVALQNDLPRLAAMGVRSLLEKIMISKAGDNGNFKENMAAFESLGYLSTKQSKRLAAILEAGHATIHREFTPSTADVITLVNITEHIVETVYLHEAQVSDLSKKVPPKTPRNTAKKAST